MFFHAKLHPRRGFRGAFGHLRESIVRHLIRSGMRFLKDDSGATAIEYAIIAGLLSIVIVAAVNSLGSSVNARFESVSTALR